MRNACCDHDPNPHPLHSGQDCLPSGTNLLLLPSRLLAATLCSAVDVVKKTFDGSYADCPQCFGKAAKWSDCCTIPETACPDPCVCRIHWCGCAGDTLKHQIQITNTGKQAREFTLTAAAFACTEETVTLAPDSKVLAPQESFMAVVSFTIPESLSGGVYHANIRLTGAFDQCIRIHLGVKPRQACCCHIEQGEIPKHVKAHQWYHHFQCMEPCFEPAEK